MDGGARARRVGGNEEIDGRRPTVIDRAFPSIAQRPPIAELLA
jgi:hypothetical protein